MVDRPEESADAEVLNYLERWGEDVRLGRARTPPPPGRPGTAQQIIQAAESVHAPVDAAADVDARLRRAAAEAAATDFRPWEKPEEALTETPGTIHMRRPTRRHLRWLVPVAASAALFVGMGIWRLALQPGSDVRSLEAGLDLWIGYSEFGSGQRGPSELRAGTTARIMFSLSRPAYHSILLLDRHLKLTVQQPNTRSEAGRLSVEWMLPADAGAGITESVMVVVSISPWQDAETMVNQIAAGLSGTREERVGQVVRAIGRHSDLAVAAQTYTVSEPD